MVEKEMSGKKPPFINVDGVEEYFNEMYKVLMDKISDKKTSNEDGSDEKLRSLSQDEIQWLTLASLPHLRKNGNSRDIISFIESLLVFEKMSGEDLWRILKTLSTANWINFPPISLTERGIELADNFIKEDIFSEEWFSIK